MIEVLVFLRPLGLRLPAGHGAAAGARVGAATGNARIAPPRPPIVAIGGITPANAPLAVAAGADALAVITSLFGADDVEAAARAFCRAFDPAQADPPEETTR
ncbi:hypothetical protein GCM10023144_32780 [Pigmentiphaga soli]|uniref:Thiamine phosphate synthase/TenI domain-containing protein n=1 Tax=Pigmentiphaga soli TaxID=1007095 RepID=A0ABP8HD65_9BURK